MLYIRLLCANKNFLLTYLLTYLLTKARLLTVLLNLDTFSMADVANVIETLCIT